MSGPAWEHGGVTLHHGDAAEVLATLPDDSVDAIVTDPPYGLAEITTGMVAETITAWLSGDRAATPAARGGFMGRDWDRFVPPPAVWDECMRVLKPGGHMLVFAGTRTWDLMAISIRLAGFEARDTIADLIGHDAPALAWVYGQGFPKSLDVAKAIDWVRDDSADVYRVTAFLAAARDAAGWTNRQIDELFGFDGMAGHWTAPAGRKGALVPTWEQWITLKKALGFGDEMDAEVKRLNERKGSPGHQRPDRVTNQNSGRVYGAGWKVVNPGTPVRAEAARWQGWGTALKPAWEPIIVARKPLAGTVAANVLRYGTGGINIDGCRLPVPDAAAYRANASGDRGHAHNRGRVLRFRHTAGHASETGRWPTNLVITHSERCAPGQCAEGCPAAELDAQSGTLHSGPNPTRSRPDKTRTAYGAFAGQESCTPARGADVGGARRFFPAFRYQAKAPASERPRLDDGTTHPTVKPLALIRWLVRLVTPPGGVVCDPFAGTGTTGQAARDEGMRAVLIERDGTYIELAKLRLTTTTAPAERPPATPEPPHDTAPVQDALFD